jgi:hypothetical protein
MFPQPLLVQAIRLCASTRFGVTSCDRNDRQWLSVRCGDFVSIASPSCNPPVKVWSMTMEVRAWTRRTNSLGPTGDDLADGHNLVSSQRCVGLRWSQELALMVYLNAKSDIHARPEPTIALCALESIEGGFPDPSDIQIRSVCPPPIFQVQAM